MLGVSPHEDVYDAGSDKNKTVQKDLVKALRSGDCALFIGSGFSMNADLPSFENVLKLIDEKLMDDSSTSQPLSRRTLSRRSTNEELDKVQFDIAKRAGYETFRSSMAEELRKEDASLPLEYVLQRQELVRLFRRVRTVATWNWDELLDGTVHECRALPLPTEDMQTPKHEIDELLRKPWWACWLACLHFHTTTLVKMQGFLSELDERSQKALVSTREQYTKLEPVRTYFHKRLRQQNTIVTIGLSNDTESSPYNPLGSRWHGDDCGGPSPKHFAILNEVENNDANREAQAMLKKRGFRVLRFPKLEDKGKWTGLRVLLTELANDLDKTPCPC